MIGLAGFAAGGIVLAENWPVGAWGIGLLVIILGVLLYYFKSQSLVFILTGSAFFTLHFLTVRSGPGVELAQVLSSQTCAVAARGIVIEQPEQRTSGRMGERSRFQFALERITIEGQSYSIKAPVIVDWTGKTPLLGDRLEFIASASNLTPPRNPGEFNQPAYFKRLGIYSILRVRFPMDGKILSSGNGNPIYLLATKARHWMQEKLRLDLEDSPEIAGLIQSLVLGLKEATPEATRQLFQATGTMHLFVVNGLHIGLFSAIAWHLLKPFVRTRKRAVFFLVPLISFYALVTGLSPGSIRATLMAAILLGGHLAERKPLSLNSLAAAAFGILLFNTNQLFLPGFQFSFGVVASILLLAPRFRRCFSGLAQPDPFLPRLLWNRRQIFLAGVGRSIAGLMGVSLAAWIGSLPFTLGYFHLITPSAVVANLLMVPAAFAILGQGILSMSAACFSTWLAALFTNANWAAVKFLLWVVHAFSAVPGGHLYLELPRPWAPKVEITVFDFGKGASIHLRTEGRDWLLDPANTGNFKAVVHPYLRSRGINRLDGLLLSHGHISNIGSALEAVDQFQPKQILDSPLRDRSGIRKTLNAGLLKRARGKTIVSRGDLIQLSPQTRMRILFPPRGFEARTADSRSLVILLETQGRRLLFMFDSGYPTEEWLLQNEPDLKCDVLIKGMHSSELSCTPVFLAATKPQLIVSGAGGNAGFSRISQQWVESLGKRTLFRQDLTGAVTISIDRDGLRAQSFLGNQKY